MEGVVDLELEESRAALQKLLGYQKEGYLFHGSRTFVKHLSPRQGSDTAPGKEEIGNLHAIYADDEVAQPIVCSLLGKIDTSKDSLREISFGPDKKMVRGRNLELGKGYVYVLPREKFRKLESATSYEWVAYEPIEPVDVIAVNPKILDLDVCKDIQFDLQ